MVAVSFVLSVLRASRSSSHRCVLFPTGMNATAAQRVYVTYLIQVGRIWWKSGAGWYDVLNVLQLHLVPTAYEADWAVCYTQYILFCIHVCVN